MSNEDKPFQGLPTILVKGGTSSTAYDREIQKRRADAETRRSIQDQQVAAQGVTRDASSVQVARLGSAAMIGATSPRLVLYYLNPDKTVRQECKSEITFYDHPSTPGELDMMFAMVCPRCLERGLPQGECQMLIRSSHRKFHIDERRKGKIVMLLDPWGNQDPVIICGTVTVDDVVRCNNYNCTYAVRINDSKVYEV